MPCFKNMGCRPGEMQLLRLGRDEKQYLKIASPYLDPLYLDFPEGYQCDPAEVIITQHGGQNA